MIKSVSHLNKKTLVTKAWLKLFLRVSGCESNKNFNICQWLGQWVTLIRKSCHNPIRFLKWVVEKLSINLCHHRENILKIELNMFSSLWVVKKNSRLTTKYHWEYVVKSWAQSIWHVLEKKPSKFYLSPSSNLEVVEFTS